jgi:hypothetical protein
MQTRALLFTSFLSYVLIGAATLAAGACSSGTTALVAGADAALGPGRAIGTPCDPAEKKPCETLTDVCSVAVCDPTSHLCERVLVDAGPTCTGGNPPPPACSGECDASSEAGDAAALDAGAPDGASDATAAEGGSDAATDARPDASDAGGD